GTGVGSLCSYGAHRGLLSFPTRRSSDLHSPPVPGERSKWSQSPSRTPSRSAMESGRIASRAGLPVTRSRRQMLAEAENAVTSPPDRKSTRLNSSHVKISYAVFCVKKKKD